MTVTKLPAEVRQAEGFDPAQSAGIFVGIRDFDDETFQEVPFAVDDAVDLAHLFTRELELIQPPRVTLVLAGEPQKAVSKARLETLLAQGAIRQPAEQTDILRLLDKQRKASGSEGLFVATFATHGFSDQGSDFLVAADTLRPFIQRTGVVLSEAFDVVAQAHALRRLVLLDACRERFTVTARRGSGGSPSASFADAIAGAQGQAVISGTTLGGYSYDDLERSNGVFTAALLDGLRGGAPVDTRNFITVRTLTDYVNERVLAWVRDHRAEDAALSRGISRRLEGAVADMPLAVNADRLAAAKDYRQRRDVALDRLRSNLDAPLTGAMFDQIKMFLDPRSPSPERIELLAEIEALDGSTHRRQALESSWRNRDPAPTSVGSDLVHQPATETLKDPSPPRDTIKMGPDRFKDPILGIDFVYIQPGSFQMGSPTSEKGRDSDERLHEVMLSRGYWMATTEVTNGQWSKLMGSRPSRFRNSLAGPVESINWYQALAFANELSRHSSLEECYVFPNRSWKSGVRYQKASFKGLDCEGYRLPTEAEWEYAARAGSQAVFQHRRVQARANCRGRQPLAVRSFDPNSWGLYEMHGNVWEWTQDSADYVLMLGPTADTYLEGIRDPLSISGSFRIVRGGGWKGGAGDCRSASRAKREPDRRLSDVGFRLVRTQHGQ